MDKFAVFGQINIEVDAPSEEEAKNVVKTILAKLREVSTGGAAKVEIAVELRDLDYM